MLETRTIEQTFHNAANTLGVSKEQIVSTLEQTMLLKRFTTVADTAKLAAFLASDAAPTITGAIVNASSGMVTD